MSTERWIPLENNPEILNAWSSKAGLDTTAFQFSDIYGLDPELLGMVPQPVKAVLLLFPITDKTEEKKAEDDLIKPQEETSFDPPLIWIKQTISNACGTIGLLHGLANTGVGLKPGSPLAKFLEECKDKTPLERAHLLETTPLFANIHAEAASSGQSAVPADLNTDLHFTCLIKATDKATGRDRILELDGRREGLFDRGPCTNLLSDAARIVKDHYIARSSSVQFSLVSLGPAVD